MIRHCLICMTAMIPITRKGVKMWRCPDCGHTAIVRYNERVDWEDAKYRKAHLKT